MHTQNRYGKMRGNKKKWKMRKIGIQKSVVHKEKLSPFTHYIQKSWTLFFCCCRIAKLLYCAHIKIMHKCISSAARIDLAHVLLMLLRLALVRLSWKCCRMQNLMSLVRVYFNADRSLGVRRERIKFNEMNRTQKPSPRA